MKLVNLVPIKEIDINDPALMRARASKSKMNQMKSNPRISFDQVLDLRGEKRDLELQINNLYREMENDPDIEPEGGPVADQYGDQLNRLEARLYKINKQIASYDMSEGEDRMNESELTDYQKSIAAKWDKESKKLGGGLFDTSRELEKTDVKQFNINVDNKVSFLTKLRDDGRFKSTKVTDDKIESWSIKPKIPGLKIAAMLKPEANEGSCGYSPDGAPGNTPGETQGMDADDRTRGMLRMLIQKEIAKLSETK